MKSPLCLVSRPVLLTGVLLWAGSGSLARAQASAPVSLAEGRTGPQHSTETPRPASSPSEVEASIPGPLRSFLRMAGISQKILPEQTLPLLARNAFSQGYEGWQGSNGRTEFLVLLTRYVEQSRELTLLAGPEAMIKVSGCSEATPLLKILGYRLRQDCGHSDSSLVTADPERAFLTTDSGFPLPALEETLQGGKAFTYPYSGSPVPALFQESDWLNAARDDGKTPRDLVDVLLNDPGLDRLYWALSRMDPETREFLRQSLGLRRLEPVAAVLDFYGSHIRIRSGRVTVPGGATSESAWKDLVGVSPASAPEFVLALLTKDKGWLAAYFDGLSRISQTRQAYFAEPHRLRRFYDALRADDLSANAARPAFRPAPGLLLLMTRLSWTPNGEPRVPGNLAVWKEILRQKSDSKIVREWGRRAGHLDRPEHLVEAMFGISPVPTDVGPLQMYLMLSEIDRQRPAAEPLSPETVRLLASNFSRFSNQYLVFSEFPGLSDVSITRFVQVADALDKISNHALRGNALGTFQANIGLWQILARQGQIPSARLNDSWQGVISPFARIASATQVFDAGCASLRELLVAAAGRPNVSQYEITELLAGPRQMTLDGQRMHQEIADRTRSALDGQRLVSLDTLLALGDGLKRMKAGNAGSEELVRLAGELKEFEMPRPIFTSGERTEWAAGIYNNHHTDLQMRTDLTKVIKSPASAAQLEEARGQLASFLRDTLVGLNYAYYEPPGAQVLHHNPLFVRSHDFSGDTVAGVERVWQAPQLFGEGTPAGGGAHLVGSLADLPYVLSEVEEDFIVPQNVQALIWRELVPGLLTSAILSRWWTVSPTELHAVALYQRSGEELLAASVDNEALRSKVMAILADHMLPQRSEGVEQALRTGHVAEILPQMMPADTFYLAAEFRRKFPTESPSSGSAGEELESLTRQHPAELSWERLSRDFGVPHPTLAQNYSPELLNVKPFPAFQGYSSRLLAESWDSSNLYWARLADEMGYAPVMLNRLVPELTRRMVEKIFATEFEDLPAILRAMRETGEEFRQGKIASLAPGGMAARP